MKNPISNFWDWEQERQIQFQNFMIGNGNTKQCSQPNFGKNLQKGIGKMLGTGSPSHAFPAGSRPTQLNSTARQKRINFRFTT